MSDIIFEGKQYKKEEFAYHPSKEPDKRMKYCSAYFYLWRTVKGRKTSHGLWEKFVNFFNKLYMERKKDKKPITWDDFKDLEF
jgi:hypothetical protein